MKVLVMRIFFFLFFFMGMLSQIYKSIFLSMPQVRVEREVFSIISRYACA